jgi:hypothetical protein
VTELQRLTARMDHVLDRLIGRVRRVEERQEFIRRHVRPETPHEREERERRAEQRR